MSINLQTNQTYSFKVHPSTVLTDSYDNCVILGTISYQIALSFSDIDVIQVQAAPHLPSGTPSDHTLYEYVLIRTANGQQTVIARPWINESTIVAKNNTSVSVVIHEASASDIAEIRSALEANGFSKLTIKVTN